LGEEYELVRIAAKEVVFIEEAHRLSMVLMARHHKEFAFLGRHRHPSHIATISTPNSHRLRVMRFELGTHEALSEDLKERFLRRKADVILSFGPGEA